MAKTTLDDLAPLAQKVAELDSRLKAARQKSNIAILSGKTKTLVLFGTKAKLKIRSRFFRDGERGVKGRTLTLSKPTDSQILSAARVLIQRANPPKSSPAEAAPATKGAKTKKKRTATRRGGKSVKQQPSKGRKEGRK